LFAFPSVICYLAALNLSGNSLMQIQAKNIFVLSSVLLLFGCIKPYDPKISSIEENKYVVSGVVTDREGWQEVEVSLSSPIESSEYLAVSNCQVKIQDNKGNVFFLEEYNPGLYHVWMDQKYLERGASYQVRITTPEGEVLASGFDTMQNGPQIDSVYYSLEDVLTPDPEITLRGMQFYVDLDAEGDYSRYYKWEVEETWEYEAARPVENFYDGNYHQVYPPDYTNKVCWSYGLVKQVFTVSTKNLSHNAYYGYPLHFIDGSTSRLGILYSILVRQLALSARAYNYWDQLRINSNTNGGLYEKQPLNIKGNMTNATKPEKIVLGYFHTASVSERRYFYHDIKGIDLDFSNGCVEEDPAVGGFRIYETWEYPIYYYTTVFGTKILSNECIDCRLMGGTTVKPDFWPK